MSEEKECDAPTYPEPIKPEPLPIPSGSGGGQAVVVDELPEKGEEGVSYWVKKEGSDSYVIYQWIGGEWRKLDMEATLYNSTGTYEDGAMTQKATTDALATKATKTEVASLADTVSSKANQSDLTSLSNTVAAKADQSDLSSLSDTVAAKADQSDLSALADDVADKADKSTVEDLADEVADKADKSEIKTYTGGKRITVNQDDSIDADGLVILSYGNSTWQDFLDAYNENAIVYCRASSEVNPATGSQGRLAFMAFITNPTNPTAVEFQYFRSVTKKDAAQQCDQIYVYKLTSANKWTVEVRNVATKIIAGTGLSSTYDNGEITLEATGGGGGGLTTLYYDENDMRFYEDSQFTTAMTTVDVVNAIYDGGVVVKFKENGGYSQTKIVCAVWGPTTVTAANASEWKAATMDGSIYNPEPLFISNFADNTFQFGT